MHVGLRESPESLHAVDMHCPVDVLLVSMIDRPVDVAHGHQSLIPGMGIREDVLVFPNSPLDDLLQSGLLRVWNELKINLPVSLEDSKDRLLPDFRSSSSLSQALETELPPCLFAEILECTSVVAFVHLHGAGELLAVVFTLLNERGTDRPVRPVDDPVVRQVKDALETSRGEAHREPVDEIIPEPE